MLEFGAAVIPFCIPPLGMLVSGPAPLAGGVAVGEAEPGMAPMSPELVVWPPLGMAGVWPWVASGGVFVV
jgi:hypothetical protein